MRLIINLTFLLYTQFILSEAFKNETKGESRNKTGFPPMKKHRNLKLKMKSRITETNETGIEERLVIKHRHSPPPEDIHSALDHLSHLFRKYVYDPYYDQIDRHEDVGSGRKILRTLLGWSDKWDGAFSGGWLHPSHHSSHSLWPYHYWTKWHEIIWKLVPMKYGIFGGIIVALLILPVVIGLALVELSHGFGFFYLIYYLLHNKHVLKNVFKNFFDPQIIIEWARPEQEYDNNPFFHHNRIGG